MGGGEQKCCIYMYEAAYMLLQSFSISAINPQGDTN